MIVSTQSIAQKREAKDCSLGCLRLAQYPYPNSPYLTPDQQYLEREREYREQKNEEYYRNEQQKLEMDQWRRRNGYGTSSRSYGAIAYSPDRGHYGYSQNYGSRAVAENSAMKECGKSDCQIAAWFYDSCGAVAADNDEGSWGGAQGSNEQRASQDAQKTCASYGGKNCKVIFSVCSR